MPPAFECWLPLIADARQEAIELIARTARTRKITRGVTHNDIFPGNVLLQDGQVTALLDWEEADLDWLVWDLACSMGPFCSTPAGDLDISAKQDFLDSYRAASGRVPPQEDDLIVPLLRVKRILEVLRAPTDRHPRWEYQLEKLQPSTMTDRAASRGDKETDAHLSVPLHRVWRGPRGRAEVQRSSPDDLPDVRRSAA
jgi:Ser/Thr protein kinase RdoA (MazF antagonist)